MNQCTPNNRVRSYLANPLSEVDSLLGQFFPTAGANARPWGGAATVYEADGRLHLELDAPGVSAEHVDVQVENGELHVTIERTAGEDAPQPLYNERRYGKVTRALALPDPVDPDTVEAELTSGVLRLSITKRPETQPRKIEVKQG